MGILLDALDLRIQLSWTLSILKRRIGANWGHISRINACRAQTMTLINSASDPVYRLIPMKIGLLPDSKWTKSS